MNRVNKISIAVMSAFLTIGSGATYARDPIAPTGPAANSSGIDLGQRQVAPAHIREEMGSPMTGQNAATPAMPGNPTANERVRENRDANRPQTDIGTDARANASGRSDLTTTPTLPRDRYDPAVRGTGSTPSVGGGAATRSEIRSGRDASSVQFKENAGTRGTNR